MRIEADPANPHPSWWHVRDYGLVVANAFGPRALGAEAAGGRIVVPRGQSLQLRYTARFFNVAVE